MLLENHFLKTDFWQLILETWRELLIFLLFMHMNVFLFCPTTVVGFLNCCHACCMGRPDITAPVDWA